MTFNTELIVLNYTRFGESSIVLHSLSREYGRKSFLVRIGKKTPMSMFLPLAILEADVVENPKATLWTAHGFSAREPLFRLRSDMYKNSIAMFISEVLFRVLKEEGREDGLYEWCVKQILTLDALESDFSNFHIWFLLELAVAMGFSPSFDDLAPFADGYYSEIRKFMSSSFSEAMLIPMTGESRASLCEIMIRYLEFHSETPLNIRSLSILNEIYED